MKRVITFGTFDHFHAGHESYLKHAKALGDYLVVIVARDKTVKQIKGAKPDFNEKERMAAVKAFGLADKVTLGNEGEKYAVIKKYKPDIIALGYDQFAFTFRLKKYLIDNKMDAKVVRLEAYRPEMFKSSIIKLYAKSI